MTHWRTDNHNNKIIIEQNNKQSTKQEDKFIHLQIFLSISLSLSLNMHVIIIYERKKFERKIFIYFFHFYAKHTVIQNN